MYRILHEDKYGNFQVASFETYEECIAWVSASYGRRFWPDTSRDKLHIANSEGTYVKSYQVDYMAQFEAVKTWTFPSSSSSKLYTTQLNKVGILSCNCPGWTFKRPGKPRHCKHTQRVERNEGLDLEARGQYMWVRDARFEQAKRKFAPAPQVKVRETSPQAIFAKLVSEYEQAIERLAALDPAQMLAALPAVETAKFKVEAYMVLLEEKGIDGTEAFTAAQAKMGRVMS